MGDKQTQREFSSTGPELGLERSRSEHPIRDTHGVIRGDRTSQHLILSPLLVSMIAITCLQIATR